MEPIRTLRSARRQDENTTITPQDQVFIHWRRIIAATSLKYRKSKEKELMRGILEEASSAIRIANTDPEIKIPPTLASAYLRLDGKTDQQLNNLDIHLIREDDPVVYRSHLQDRIISEHTIRRGLYACGSNQWWIRLSQSSSRHSNRSSRRFKSSSRLSKNSSRLSKSSSRQRATMGGANRLRQPKERRQTPIYIRIPSLIHRHSRVSDASATLRHLTGQLEAISERLQQLQNLIDANEEDLRKKQENLNKLVVDIEEKAVDELRMQQRVQLLEKCFCLLQKQRNARL